MFVSILRIGLRQLDWWSRNAMLSYTTFIFRKLIRDSPWIPMTPQSLKVDSNSRLWIQMDVVNTTSSKSKGPTMLGTMWLDQLTYMLVEYLLHQVTVLSFQQTKVGTSTAILCRWKGTTLKIFCDHVCMDNRWCVMTVHKTQWGTYMTVY